MKKATKSALLWLGLGMIPAALLFTNAAPQAPASFPYASLANNLDSSGLCRVRPSSAGRVFYDAISASRAAKEGLAHPQIIHHAANRLGYGVSPHGPLVPSLASDCTTVFMAEELVRQIAGMNNRSENAYFANIRSKLLPISRLRRNDINAEFGEIRKRAAGVQAHGSIASAMAMEVPLLMVIRGVLGSQNVGPDGRLYDHQMNLQEVLNEFWFNHFNVAAVGKSRDYSYGTDGYPEAVRAHTGSTFYSMLLAVMSHPGMVFYLDNQTNIAKCTNSGCIASNQNLAREVMELHTFGVGPKTSSSDTSSPYSQADIEKMALILAGWNLQHPYQRFATDQTELTYNSKLAANIPVTLFGKTYSPGPTRVPAVLKELANHAWTKNGVCRKLAVNLFAPELVIEARNACLANWGSGGNLRAIYTAMLSLPSFWSSRNYMKINKSPVEVAQSVARAMGANIIDLSLRASLDVATTTSFAPRSILAADGQTYLANYRAHRQKNAMHFVMGINAGIGRIGLDRANFTEPTGYPEDRMEFLSTFYLDNVSRAALDLGPSFWWIDRGTGVISGKNKRLDIVTEAIAGDLSRRGPTQATTHEYWLRYLSRVGDTVRFTNSGVVFRAYELPTSQSNIVKAILSNRNSYATFTNESGTYQQLERTFAAVNLANSSELKK